MELPVRQNIHWPWAPVIIGSTLILLSILMRVYEFDNTFINLVASAGDIVIVFSLLYIIKVFLIDDTSRAYAVVQGGGAAVMQSSILMQPAVVAADRQTTDFKYANLQFSILDVDEHASRVRVQCIISAETMRPDTSQQATIELMRHQKEIKDAVRSFATTQHGPEFDIVNLGDIHIERQADNSLKLVSSYGLENR